MSSTKDLISVIIPVYNRENVIEECINSVLAQSYQNFEIILVDDGSIDNTYEVCKELAEKEPRIKLFEGEHGGVSAARNKALDEASGEYVFFLDSDDVIYPLLLDTLVSAMENTGASIAGSSVAGVKEANWFKIREKLQETPTPGETAYRTNEEALYAIFHPGSPLACIGGVMMKKDLIGDTRFRTDLSIGEDYYFNYENLIKGASCVFLEPKWYYVRLHNHNSSWDYTFDGFWSRFRLRELVWRSEESFGRTEYANIKKGDALSSFSTCIQHNRPYSKDNRKMRKVLRQYRKELWPGFSSKRKIVYLLSMYFPASSALLFKVKKKLDAPRKQLGKPVKNTKTNYKGLLHDYLNLPLDNGDKIFERFASLPGAVVGKGTEPLQRYVYVPGTRKDRVLLVAHADTVWDKAYKKPFPGEHSVVFENGVFKSDNPECGIGADDRAGCAMLWELRNSGHSILITDGEEHGKVGAKYLKKTNRKLYRELNRHRYMLALDLKGTDNCSFNQVYNTKKFKQYIENELGFANGKSTGGNDLQILCHRVGGANLGIGYHDFHTNKETLVLSEWENTLNKVTTFLERPQQKFHSRVLPKYMRYAEICVNKGLRILKFKK